MVIFHLILVDILINQIQRHYQLNGIIYDNLIYFDRTEKVLVYPHVDFIEIGQIGDIDNSRHSILDDFG
jgi:hypothetical protein